MDFRAWTWRHIALIWGGALALSLVLLAVRFPIGRPRKFFWLFPYGPGVRGGARLVVAVTRAEPLLVLSILVVPVMALAVTVAWLLRR